MSVKSALRDTVIALGLVAAVSSGVMTFRDYKYGRIPEGKVATTWALAKNFAYALKWGFSQTTSFLGAFFDELLKDSPEEEQKSQYRDPKKQSFSPSPSSDRLAANENRLIHAFMLESSGGKGESLPLLSRAVSENMKKQGALNPTQAFDIS